MKKTLCWIVLLAFVVGGCASIENMRQSVKDRVGGVPPKTRLIKGDFSKVYAAARETMEQMGFRLTRGGPAQGLLEGITRIDSGGELGPARQRTIKIHLQALDGGETEVQVRLTEIVEAEIGRESKSATENALRESGSYDVFFAELERRLAAPTP